MMTQSFSLSLILAVGTGGALGSLLRYGISVWLSQQTGSLFPWGTLMVNIAGCFLIGLLMAVAEKSMIPPEWRLFWTTGLCGGLTTFSTFSFETWALLKEGVWELAMVYLVGSLVVALTATWVGLMAGRIL